MGTIISLQPKRCGTIALARLDVTAVELLAEGRAATLLGARLAAIQADLLAKRGELAAMIADLQMRPPSGDARLDAVNTTLRTEANKGLAYLEMLLSQLEACPLRTG